MTNIILIHQIIGCVLFFQIVWHFENKTDKRKYSNIFTLWSSILLSIFSIIYIITRNNYYASLTYAIFISYLILEIIYGSIYFNEYMPLISGYIHHIIYILITIYSLYTYDMEILSLFSICFLVEVPTILLNLKRYYNIKSKKLELIYGILFFIFRIILNIYLIYTFKNFDNLLWSSGIIVLFVHLKVFYDWYKKYNNSCFLTKKYINI